MAESQQQSPLEQLLEVALNPIGSLALRERLEGNRPNLIATFNIVAPRAVQLILSPYGYRFIECCLNANSDAINYPLSDSLSENWSGLEQVLKLERGRYVCETLLNRKLLAFTHKLIKIVPKYWWFNNAASLSLLIKALTNSEIDEAKEFMSGNRMEQNLCDSAEGLYCVLKVKGKSMDEPGWRDALDKLIVLKAQTIAGSDALVQAILYGDYLVQEMVEVICCRRESYDNSNTVTLIIRLIEKGSIDLKRLIVKYLCEPNNNPMICQIRNSARFADLKAACDAHFTEKQRTHLNNRLAAAPVRSVVDECLTRTVSTPEPESMNTERVDSESKKRRADPPITSQSTAKKPREAPDVTAIPLPSTVPLPATVPSPITVSASSSSLPVVNTVAQPATVPTPATVPVSTTELPPSTSVHLAKTVAQSATTSSSATVPVSAIGAPPGTVPRPITVPPPSTSLPVVNAADQSATVPSQVTVPMSTSVAPSATVPQPATVPTPATVPVSAIGAPPVTVPRPITVPPPSISLPVVNAADQSATVPSQVTVPLPTTVPLSDTLSLSATVSTPSISLSTVTTVTTSPSPLQLVFNSLSSVNRSIASVPAPAANTVSPSDSPRLRGSDPGGDVINMAMSEKNRVLLSRLDKSPSDLSPTIFNCIRNGLLALMMDERGSEVVKWFITKGSLDQKGTIEKRVAENVEDLVENGGYGRSIARMVIDNCANPEKRKRMEEIYEKVIKSPRASASPVLIDGFSSQDEIEIIEQSNPMRTFPKKKPSWPKETTKMEVRKESAPSDFVGKGITMEEIIKEVGDVKGKQVSEQESRQIRQMFLELDGRIRYGKLTAGEFQMYAAGGILKDGGVSQVFIDLVQERVSRWTVTWNGRCVLNAFTSNKILRPFMVVPVLSVLHLPRFDYSRLLEVIMSSLTRKSVFYHCLMGNEESPFVKIFQSQMETDKCLDVGMKIANVNLARFRELLLFTPLLQSLAKTEKGQKFIESLAKPSPVGFGWSDLPHLSSSQPTHNPDSSTAVENPQEQVASAAVNDGNGETSENSNAESQVVATAQPTVVPPQDYSVPPPVDTTTPSNTHALIAQRFRSNFNNWRSGSGSGSGSGPAAPPSFQSPLISISSSGVPSFPIARRTSMCDGNGETAEKENAEIQVVAPAQSTVAPPPVETKPPLFQSSHITVSPTGIPSFPTRAPIASFSFIGPKMPAKAVKTENLSFSTIARRPPLASFSFGAPRPHPPPSIEKIVQETVEFIVSGVVRENP